MNSPLSNYFCYPGNKKADDGEPDKMQIAGERIRRLKRWIAAGIRAFFCNIFKRAKVASSEKNNPIVMVIYTLDTSKTDLL